MEVIQGQKTSKLHEQVAKTPVSSNTMTLLPQPPLTLMIVWKEGHGERGQGDVIKINSLKIKKTCAWYTDGSAW